MKTKWLSSLRMVAPKLDNNQVYEDRFEWLLNLSPEARGELDDAGSPVYFTKLTVTPDDERAWFRMHPQWSKSNKYAELEAWIFI
ncbi:hypothetical protein [uncultured Parabacteroides sp.]|uniref:hypothetical protein n=1 Tax=uncultured Parabacteroides sp. TaxID=512312 RepID=UPI0025CE0176|nr:hypothetical protein [uncultured Parabacteroides sp.]